MARANWHTPQLLDVAADPFAPRDVGVPIRLDGPHAELQAELVELVRREGELAAAGVECDIKQRTDTSCHACPLQDRGELCDVGRAQESVCTRLAVEARADAQ